MISKNSKRITSVESWFEFAPPMRGKLHWKDNRSAKELAKAWFPVAGQEVMPEALKSLLNSVAALQDFQLVEGSPEKVVQLDSFEGESSNIDLLLVGAAMAGKVVIGIEAKADEELGATLENSFAKVASKDRSNKPKRINNLCMALFGKTFAAAPELHTLRYQLFTGIAGALIEAAQRNASAAVFVVHEFISQGLDQRKLERNKADFIAFLEALSVTPHTPLNGWLHGPVQVPGFEKVPSNIPLYIGKAQTHLRSTNP